MNVGFYQSASALSALERWQETVAQNITSSQTAGYRKRAVNFSAQAAGEVRHGSSRRPGGETVLPMQFPEMLSSINYRQGEVQPTRREFDLAIQGEGFFEVRAADGSRLYTRMGEFRLRPDRTLVTSSGAELLSAAEEPIMLLPEAGKLVVNLDGTLVQGDTPLGRLAIKSFADPSTLRPVAGGFFVPVEGSPAAADAEGSEVLQGYLEASNVTPLREMVDLIVISRAYEANQKIISTVEQQVQKALEALG